MVVEVEVSPTISYMAVKRTPEVGGVVNMVPPMFICRESGFCAANAHDPITGVPATQRAWIGVEDNMLLERSASKGRSLV